MRKERPEIALMFGTLFCVTVSAGLRSGEIRAIDNRGQIGLLKKGTDEDPRNRAVIIPEITLNMLERWLGIENSSVKIVRLPN
ncbi:MAG: hypothetical protein LBT16_08225 [Treponema sp.]|jgi:hypothetical protein|nr:hypothetical protein [Treponema sp.]